MSIGTLPKIRVKLREPKIASPVRYLSWATSDERMIRAICFLYLSRQMFELDPCFRRGTMYGKMPVPKLRYDINPDGRSPHSVEHGDITDLIFKDFSIKSACFDLPYLIKTGDGSQTKEAFGEFDSMKHLEDTYQGAFKELFRVLVSGGIVAAKVQDTTYSGKKYPLSFNCWQWAQDEGFLWVDEGAIIRKNPRKQPGNRTQRSLAAAHCKWLVFQKPKSRRKPRKT